LYKVKYTKSWNFTFEHCWIILKDHPKWVDGWTQLKPPTSKKKTISSDLDSNYIELEGGFVLARAIA
jgi:hypothetical protein